MKKTTTIIAVALLFAGAVFAQNNTVKLEVKEIGSAQNDTAIIEFTKTSHNFGEIVVGTQAKTTFEYKNQLKKHQTCHNPDQGGHQNERSQHSFFRTHQLYP